MVKCVFILDGYFVTWGGGAADRSSKDPLKAFGKSLGKLNIDDWKQRVDKGIQQFSKSSTKSRVRPKSN